MPKHTEKFDPAEVPILLDKARAGDLVARDELLYRFQRLVATLVNVCITGRPNFWSSYQKTFLRMFASKNVPLQNIATTLKRGLAGYEKDELFSTGQLAVLVAIERCESNLASTIVICFKDLIHKMIKDPIANKTTVLELDSHPGFDLIHYEPTFDDELFIQMLKEKLTEPEIEIVEAILEGKHPAMPGTLKIKIERYLRS